MKKVKITVMRKIRYDDLIEQYENPLEHACDINEGQVFIANGMKKPEGLCETHGKACRHLSWRWRAAPKIFTAVG